MADISKIKIPNGSEYDLKVYTDHIAPMMSKTFTGVVGTANTDVDCTFFFGTIRPTSWFDIWKIKYRVYVHITGTASTYNQYAEARSEATWFGSENTYQATHNLNHIHNTSYRPAYYNTIYNLKKAGFDAGLNLGHALGIGLRYSWNAYSASYPREITVQILQCENCQFTFLDNMIKWTALPSFNTTNYDTYRQTDFASNGLQETSDNNDVNYQNRIYYSNPGLKAYAAGGRYTITFTKDNNYVLPITSTDNSYSGGAKVYTTESFDPFGEIYYRNASGAIAAEAQIGNATLYRQIMVDARYSFTGVLNGSSSVMAANKPVYIVCTPQSDGFVKLAENPLAFELPATEDGLFYILLGYSYNTYQFELLLNHPIYWYKDGKIRQYFGDPYIINGHTVNADVPSDAKFTDTTYESKAAAQNGTAVSLVTTGQKYIWNNKTSNTGTVTKVTAGTGLSIGSTAGGNFTTSGTINHTNAVTAQTTQALYPIKIDAQGHISAYGSAVTPLTASSTLDATKLSGTVPTACLPSYVDDVLQYTAKANFPATGQTGKIYVDKTTNLTWRWGGSAYVQISPSLALGTTSSTAYRGDYGNTAYTHATDSSRLTTATSSGLYKVAATAQGHIASLTAVQKSDITGLGIPGTDNDTKNTAGSTDSSKKLFLIGAETQAANPQTYSQDTAYVGTDGKLYSNSKVVLTGGSNASSAVTITPSTTDVYSMTSAGSVTAGTANVPTKIDTTKFSGGSFTRGTFSQGTLPTLTFAMDTTDTKKLKITFGQGTLPTHAADSFTAAALQSGFYTAGTANTPTAVTLPSRSSSAIKAWTGYTAATAAAQTFTGSSS